MSSPPLVIEADVGGRTYEVSDGCEPHAFPRPPPRHSSATPRPRRPVRDRLSFLLGYGALARGPG